MIVSSLRGWMRHLVFLSLLAAWSASAGACGFWQGVTFGDGSKACIGEMPFARLVSPEVGRSVEAAVPQLGGYVVALPLPVSSGEASCPAVAGLSVIDTSNTAVMSNLPPLRARTESAVLRCQAALRAANATPGACNCEVVLIDGASQLSRAQFDRVARQEVSLQAASASAPAVNTQATHSGSPAGSSEARLQAELAEMRQMLSQLGQRTAQGNPPSARPSPAAAAGAPRLTARALVIGNSAYTGFGRLPNPQNDARAIAAKLRSFNIEVDLVLNADREALIRALSDYTSRAAGTDVNILFYAGHGVQVEGVNYLVPTNMRADNISAGYIKLAGISLNAALDYLPARTRLVFLDACRDNPVSRSLVATRSAASAGLAPMNTSTGTLIAYATKDGATAEDGAGNHSPYTAALLSHLDAPVDISLVLRQVRQSVLRTTSNRQEPWEYGSLVGDQLVLSVMARP